MADTFDAATRSWIMSRVASRGTRPEKILGEVLEKARIRFSTNGKELPGNPDIVIRKIHLAVFVNGCFWHWHGCKRSRMPTSNVTYWEQKIARNVSRDKRAKRALSAAGWHYWTIWECDLHNGASRLIGRIKKLEQNDR